MVKEVFRDRYVFDEAVLEDVRGINSITELYQANNAKTLILDINTFERTYMFIRNDILCYSNLGHPMVRSPIKKIEYYGYYDYQNFDYQTPLKFNFAIFRPLPDEIGDSVFVSSISFNYKDIDLPESLRSRKILTKKQSVHHSRLFSLFSTLYYHHANFDTNNRLIPECFFYKKEIILEANERYKDSILPRYTDILQHGLAKYTLDYTDKMISDFLS